MKKQPVVPLLRRVVAHLTDTRVDHDTEAREAIVRKARKALKELTKGE